MGLDAGRDASSWGDANASWDLGSDASQPPTYVVTFERPSADIGLVPGEALPVTARVRDTFGNPLASVRVDLALIGAQLDSSLSDLIVYTDVDGRVQFYVFGGLMPTAFQLRVSTSPIDGAYLRVSVVDTPTGALSLTVDPAEVALLTGVTAFAFANATCNEAETLPPSASTTFVPTATGTLTLHTGATYAVVTIGEDSVSGLTYMHCVEDVDVGITTSLSLDFGLAGP